MKTIAALPLLSLFLSGPILAQTPVTAASTVVFTKPSTADTYIAAHAGAKLVKAESDKLTYQNPDHSLTLVSGKGLTYQQNGVWLPSQLQVAALKDGSGWTVNGVAINASLTGSAGQDKDLSVIAGSVTMNLHMPQLSYNGDDTFTFKEKGTTWLLRVAEASVSIQTTVAKRTGKAQHTLGYNSFGAALTVDAKGDLYIGGAVHVTRPLIVGANQKLYGCSAWSSDASGVSFTCDDTSLPDAKMQ
jgi:hypothetical protein